MRIVTYTADSEAPANARHVAHLYQDGKVMPVVFHGAEPQGPRAEEWWADQQAKAAKLRKSKPKPASDDVGDVI